ncbi:MAG: hypothetical protein AAB599_00030 [Patescibacteria group bacterium]
MSQISPCLTDSDVQAVAKAARRFGNMRDVLSGDIPSLLEDGITAKAQHAQTCFHCRIKVNSVKTNEGGIPFEWGVPRRPAHAFQMAFRL